MPIYTPGRLPVLLCLLLLTVISTRAQRNYLTNFPDNADPRKVGNRIATHFIATPHTNFGRTEPPRYITYPETCTWFGALKFAAATGSRQLQQQLKDRFEPLFDAEKNLLPQPVHVDYCVFGSVPLELYRQTKEPKYLELGRTYADRQWTIPDNAKPEAAQFAARGYSWQTRLWIDDMFMITAVQMQAGLATGDTTYINRAAREMEMYLDSLQRPNGLFYHAPDVPYFWGRGDGWMAAGMAFLLSVLPATHPSRPHILTGYRKMMASLKQYQDKDGMWHQLIDDPTAWPETSCTGMFTFAMIMGVKKGWLDAAAYGPVARKGWTGLVTYINPDGDIRDVCEGTNKKNDRQYYLDRKKNVGDLHGQAPILWCAYALCDNH